MAYELDLFGCDMIGEDSSPPGLDDVRAGRAVLTSGDKGDAVKYVQGLIGVTVDGVYGPNTIAAVKAFQSAHSLTADGVVGKQTLAVLDQVGFWNAGNVGPAAPFVPVIPAPSASAPPAYRPSMAPPVTTKPKSPEKKTSPLVIAGIALGGALAVGGGLWVVTK